MPPPPRLRHRLLRAAQRALPDTTILTPFFDPAIIAFALGLLADAAFYGAYAWIAISTVRETISLGDMAMYLTLFRQGQSAVSASLSAVGGMYEDNLYLSNLYDYLEQPGLAAAGGATAGIDERAGIVEKLEALKDQKS